MQEQLTLKYFYVQVGRQPGCPAVPRSNGETCDFWTVGASLGTTAQGLGRERMWFEAIFRLPELLSLVRVRITLNTTAPVPNVLHLFLAMDGHGRFTGSVPLWDIFMAEWILRTYQVLIIATVLKFSWKPDPQIVVFLQPSLIWDGVSRFMSYLYSELFL